MHFLSHGSGPVLRLVNRAGTPFPASGPVRPGADVSIPNIYTLQGLVEPSGGLLVLGRAISGFDQPRVNRLTRLSPGGTPDASFELRATEAIWCNDIPGLRTRMGAVMAHRADRKLLVAQSFRVSATLGTSRTCISRLQPDGTLDPTFGSGGQVVLGWEFLWDEMSPVAIFALPSGGTALSLQMRRQLDGNFHYYYMIATMTADGALDASRFDRGISGPTDLHVAKLTAVARQADGRFLIAGYPALGDNLPAPPGGPVERFDRSQPRIGRVHPEGGADLSVGPPGTGYASLLSFGKRLEPRHLHIGPDRGILVAGAAAPAGPVTDNEITRFAVGKLVGEK